MGWDNFGIDGSKKTRDETPFAATLVETVVFTSDGSFVKADYPDATHVKVRLQAAGGGSGGTDATTSGNAESGGGGGGEYAEKIIAAGDLSTSETVTVGTGGAGGSAGNNAGTQGGDSSFGSHFDVEGGFGGTGSAQTTGSNSRDAGEGGFNGTGVADFRVRGFDGGNGVIISGIRARGNHGGASHLGSQQSPTTSLPSSKSGQPYGGGGPGICAQTSQSAAAGRPGADGVCVVEVHSINKSALATPLDAPVFVTSPTTSEILRYNGSTEVWENTVPEVCEIHDTSTNTITHLAYPQVAMDSTIKNSELGAADVANDRITIKRAGNYVIGAWAYWDDSANDFQHAVQFRVNNVDEVHHTSYRGATGSLVYFDAWMNEIERQVYDLEVGDHITLHVRLYGGAAQSVDLFESALWIREIL